MSFQIRIRNTDIIFFHTSFFHSPFFICFNFKKLTLAELRINLNLLLLCSSQRAYLCAHQLCINPLFRLAWPWEWECCLDYNFKVHINPEPRTCWEEVIFITCGRVYLARKDGVFEEHQKCSKAGSRCFRKLRISHHLRNWAFPSLTCQKQN